MELKLTQHLAQYLLGHYFRSKREMAMALDIPYRVVLRLFNETHTPHDLENILYGILYFSMSRRIPPQEMLHGLALR